MKTTATLLAAALVTLAAGCAQDTMKKSEPMTGDTMMKKDDMMMKKDEMKKDEMKKDGMETMKK